LALRRGFKAEAERIAQEMRGELCLRLDDPLDSFKLAKHLEIPVYGLRQLRRFSSNPIFISLFAGAEQESFSAMTVFVDMRRLIIHNETHAITRQASNLAHEVSHCLLEHAPSPISSSGCRTWQSDIEDEASWLGAALLVPREGALRLAVKGLDIPAIAAKFCVSEPLCRWRVAQTGVVSQLQRRQRYSSD